MVRFSPVAVADYLRTNQKAMYISRERSYYHRSAENAVSARPLTCTEKSVPRPFRLLLSESSNGTYLCKTAGPVKGTPLSGSLPIFAFPSSFLDAI